MNLPSFPTDSLHKFLFIGGIVMIVLAITIVEDNYKEMNKESDEYFAKLVTLNLSFDKLIYEQECLNEDLKYLNTILTTLTSEVDNGNFIEEEELKKIDELNNEIEIKQRELKIFKMEIDAEQEIINYNEGLTEYIAERVTNTRILMNLFLFLGFSLIIIGLINWSKSQKYQDKILEARFVEASSFSQNCQSCGMLLKYDLKVNKGRGSKYCTHCYDGSKYIHPNISLDDFKKEISEKMKEQGFKRRNIAAHLSSLNSLDRWKRSFRW